MTVLLSTCPEAGDLTLWKGVRPLGIDVDCVKVYREASVAEKHGVLEF